MQVQDPFSLLGGVAYLRPRWIIRFNGGAAGD